MKVMVMDYDVIIIGATFTATGLLRKYSDRCLVIERRPQAGYEFLNALKFGTDYDKELKTVDAKELYERFVSKNAFCGENICLFDCAGSFYSLLEGKNVLLNMEIVSVEKNEEGFTVTAHGVSGYRTFTSKKVIDTTIHEDMIKAKTLNFIVNTDKENPAPLSSDLKTEKWGYAEDTLIKCTVNVNDGYIEARRILTDLIKTLPSDYKVALVADCFDYEIKSGYPIEKDGIVFMPSCAYKNPLLAFDAGVVYGEGDVQ